MESGGTIRWVRMRLVWGLRHPVSWTSPSTCSLLTLAGLGVSQGGFRAESRTVLGKAQAPRVEVSQRFYWSGFIQQGFYCSGFINPTNKQTNQTNKQTNSTKQINKQTNKFSKKWMVHCWGAKLYQLQAANKVTLWVANHRLQTRSLVGCLKSVL